MKLIFLGGGKSMEKSIDLQMLKDIIYVKGLTPHRLALNIGIEPSNFSRFLTGKAGMLSHENLLRVTDAIGFDLEKRSLKPGIHRFLSKSMSVADMDRIEGTIRTLLPGGVNCIPVKPVENLKGYMRYDYLLVPHLQRDIRVILSIKTLSAKSIFTPERALRLGGLGAGSRWRGGAASDECPSDSALLLPAQVVDRIVGDKSLTIEDLDEIVGISADPNEWSWEMVIASLEAKGITPREAAKKWGLI